MKIDHGEFDRLAAELIANKAAHARAQEKADEAREVALAALRQVERTETALSKFIEAVITQ